jgi:5-methylcytosine-specific restriction endonuclease McrA
MDEQLVWDVWRRASGRCEYCQLPQTYDDAPFELDHIIALKHHGVTAASNLALSCLHCNSFKGPNIAGFDLRTKKLVPLFNPRRHRWPKHFCWNGAQLKGLTAIGRVTVAVLNINDPYRVELREGLIKEGVFP